MKVEKKSRDDFLINQLEQSERSDLGSLPSLLGSECPRDFKVEGMMNRHPTFLQMIKMRHPKGAMANLKKWPWKRTPKG